MNVLILEDSEPRLKLIRRGLIGHHVVRTYDTKEAFNLLLDKQFDLVMLDHDLGDAPGWDKLDNFDCGSHLTERILESRHTENFKNVKLWCIHSLNPWGADLMEGHLKDAGKFLGYGYKVIKVPFIWDQTHDIVTFLGLNEAQDEGSDN